MNQWGHKTLFDDESPAAPAAGAPASKPKSGTNPAIEGNGQQNDWFAPKYAAGVQSRPNPMEIPIPAAETHHRAPNVLTGNKTVLFAAIITGICLLFVIAGGSGYLLYKANQEKRLASLSKGYEATETTLFQNDSFSLKVPKAWQDASRLDDAAYSLTDSKDVAAFADNLEDPKAFALVQRGTSALPFEDAALQQAEAETTVNKVVSGLEPTAYAFLNRGSKNYCDQLSDKQTRVVQSASFVLTVRYEANCTTKSGIQKIVSVAGIKNKTVYVLSLRINRDVWEKNNAILDSDIISSFKPI